MIVNSKTQIRHLNMKRFGRDTQPRSQQYSVGVHTVHMLILTDLLSYNSSFDDATSDEQTECVESKTKASISIMPLTASWIQMVDY